MLALVRAHIDQLGSSPDGVNRSFDNSFRRRDKSDHRAIVIGIDMRIEHARRFDRRDSFSNQPNRFRLAGLR